MLHLLILLDMRVLINYDCRMWQGYRDSITCFMMLNTKYLCFAPGWAVYGVWCEVYQVTVSELWLSGLLSRLSLVNVPIRLLWLAESPHVLVCVTMLLWPSVTPVTSVNTGHKLFSSQFTKLPGVTNQHQLTHERARAVGEEGSDHMRAVGLGCHNMTNAHTHICNHFVKTSIISTLSCKTFYQVSEKFDSTAAKSWRVG